MLSVLSEQSNRGRERAQQQHLYQGDPSLMENMGQGLRSGDKILRTASKLTAGPSFDLNRLLCLSTMNIFALH